MLGKITALIVSASLLSITSLAGQSKFVFDNFSTETGLSSRHVYSITQDRYGLMWFGTDEGLNRFDGSQYTVFSHNRNGTSGLNSSWINCLLTAADGRIWIGTENGVSIFDPRNGTLRLCVDSCDTKNRLSTQRIKTIFEDSNHTMWLGTTSGLIKYDFIKGNLDFFTLSHDRQSQITNEVSSIVEDKNGKLWLGTFHGIYNYDPDDNSLVWYEARSHGHSQQWNNLVESIYYPAQKGDTLYLATSSGLVVMSLDGHIVKSFNTHNSTLCDDDIRTIAPYDSRYLLLGTANGLAVYDSLTDAFTNFNSSRTDNTSLIGESIRSIYEDSSGNIWIATLKGLSKLDKNRKPIDLYRIVEREHDIRVNDIESVDGHYWLATDDGISVCNDDFKSQKIYTTRDGLLHPIVKRILTDSHGTVWIGTNNGIGYYDQASDSFRKVNESDGNFFFKYIYDLKEDSKHNIITNISSGICLITPQYDNAGRIRSFKFKPVIISDMISTANCDIPFFETDSNGVIWIGTISDGIVKYNDEDGSWKLFNEDNGLISNRIYSLFIDRKDNVWVGTERGLCVIDNADGSIRSFEQDIYLSKSIRTITADKQERLWVATNDKLIMFDPKSDDRIICNLNSQLGVKEMIHNSIYSDDKYIYMGGDGCLIRFDPAGIRIGRNAPDVVLSSFHVSRTDEKSDGTLLPPSSITALRKIRLAYDQNDFTVDFTMPNYSSPQSNRYLYMLDGYDDDWIATDGGNNSARYSNLSPGTYNFLVRGCNPDGVWCTNTTKLTIIIAPPLWNSPFAYILYALVIIGFVLLIAKFIMARIKLNAELKIEKFERARIEKLNELKMQFFTNISHEFKTPLSLILGPTESLMDTITDANALKQLEIVRQNGNRLLELINQIMDLRKIDAGKVSLSLGHGDLVLYIKRLFDNFRLKAEERDICYEFESDIDSLDMSFDSDKIEKIMFNLISNAFKFTPEHGTISVVLRTIETSGRKEAEIRISDTGCGIPSQDIPHIFERFYQSDAARQSYESMKGSGIGLVVVKDYVALHGGNVGVTSEVGRGSVFRFTIPCDLVGEKEERVDSDECTALPELPKGGRTPSLKPKIVVIEDNYDMLTFLKINLESSYDVYTAQDGETGYKLICDIYPELIISDLMMPGIDGFEVCRRVKQEILTCHIPFIILTAKNDDTSQREGYMWGADDYISKPFGVKALHTRVDSLIEMRRKIQSSFKQQFLLSPTEVVLDNSEDRLINTLVKIVEDNIADPEFGIQQLCEQAKYPYQQVYRKIKAFTGESINEFIRDIRLKRAAQYLGKSDLRISEVMYKVGFNSHSYFTKCFREYYGVSPTEYISKTSQSDPTQEK